ncbi:MAG: VWA domain-containing protein [Muribaculaceae bacterium]|nr:VWA domain-containing protein [Muribaculaceae bacterium]
MYKNGPISRICWILLALIIPVCAFAQGQSRLRNTIYVLDCTGSMGGYNGAPDIWMPTKAFLKAELEKEAKENPSSQITILPFQQKVLHPIYVDLENISWPTLEKELDGYLKNITATNICDSWLEAERYIDQAQENYIILLTDGHDNIGGSVNESNRSELLAQILRSFCGKYRNTKGFYIELTAAASLPAGIQNAIDVCNDLYKLDASAGIPSFGCNSDDVIHLNTRDLPVDITLGFSNSGTFAADIVGAENPFVEVTVKDNRIAGGKVVLQFRSKLGDNIETLNKAINAPAVEIPATITGEDVIITNPDIDIVLHNKPLRSLDLATDGNLSEVSRVRPFLWIKGNPADTLRWDLAPVFSHEAVLDRSSAMFKVGAPNELAGKEILFNGSPVGSDSTVSVQTEAPAVLEIVVPQSAGDGSFDLTLAEIHSVNLDRINGQRPEHKIVTLSGVVTTRMSLLEVLCWSVLGLIVLFLLVWFGVLRNRLYPKFKKGIVTVQNPYFATIRVKGYRSVVFSAQNRTQSLFDRLWRGKILYHTNGAWPCEAQLTPAGTSMRFRCPSGALVCDPSPVLTRGMTFKILDVNNPSFKIDLNLN